MIGYNRDDAFVDAGLLRDHVSRLKKQEKIAIKLHECIVGMKRLSNDPETLYQCCYILCEVERMIHYFSRMASVLEQIEHEAICTSIDIRRMIEEGIMETRHTVENNLML